MTLLDRYATVLRGTGAASPLAASVVGRLPLGMTGLAVLLLTREATGSYAAAGAVSAAYALAFAVVSPARARTADRRGPVRIVLLMGALHPVALLALVLLAASGADALPLAGAAVVAGATVPPLGAVMRALWGRLVVGPALATAYALEAVVIELCFVGGPLLVALLAGLLGPSAAVLAAAVLTLGGTVWLVSTPALRAVRPTGGPTHVLGPLTAPPVRGLLLSVGAIGAGFGSLEVALPAFVESTGGRPATAGILLAVWAVGSVVGGLTYGALHPQAPHSRQLPWLVGALAIGTGLPLIVGGPAAAGLLVMGGALFLYGLTIAPFSACNSVLLGGSAPPGTVTEAFAWNSSMMFGGAALGAALAGALVEGSGVAPALAVTAGTGVAAYLLCLRAVRRLPVTAGQSA
ncbi:MAG TPA: MFS transporter [Mycobacteriales bacterium]|nr:MFS transporter [Mycobacteriales bacterium]